MTTVCAIFYEYIKTLERNLVNTEAYYDFNTFTAKDFTIKVDLTQEWYEAFKE